MIILKVTLCTAAAAGILAIWLMVRVGQVRQSQEVSVGDAGNDHVIRRMRAHANFIETTPIALILIAAIELTGKGEPWLSYVAAAFLIGRVAHMFGMEPDGFGKGRLIGTMAALLTFLGLGVVAVLIALGVM